jgi:hypothetical protein
MQSHWHFVMEGGRTCATHSFSCILDDYDNSHAEKSSVSFFGMCSCVIGHLSVEDVMCVLFYKLVNSSQLL